eukprot:TRINITY_DN1104_c0_g1_i1.p1 TRINITY_DN1104_c0_g1~~TRINITY_DN1104_c0_g1_i1.p1  ORF type:complete len:464 (-),score=134.61 TRINITY_DN1104_c0_g1_i1:127-1452(-)
MSMMQVLAFGIVAVLCFFVDADESSASGLVLLQRQVEAVAGDLDGVNSTTAHEEMYNTLGDMKAMDAQLQHKAHEQSEHLAALVADYDTTLNKERRNIAIITNHNEMFRKEIEKQQSLNDGLRTKLNSTKQKVARVARDLRAFAAKLSDSGSDLDVILQEDVEMTPPLELSALQIEAQDDAHPDDQMTHLKSSLEDIHSQVEAELTEKFNATYNGLILYSKKLTKDKYRLEMSLDFERRQGAALQKQIDRLEKMMRDMAESDSIVRSNVATIGDAVSLSKEKSSRRAELLLAKNLNASSAQASPVQKHSPSTHKDEKQTPGLFGRAVRASKAALASAGKKMASVFGGAHVQDSSAKKAAVGANSSHASQAKMHVNTTHHASKTNQKTHATKKIAPKKTAARAAHPLKTAQASAASHKPSGKAASLLQREAETVEEHMTGIK